jgi:uncharacterized protein
LPDDFSFEDEDRLGDSFFGQPDEGERPPRDADGGEEREVKVIGVYEHRAEDNPQPTAFVLLRDAAERSVLIFIGKFEAMSIWLALEGASADRPLTHDLLNNVVDRMGGKVERILIDDLWNNTYYAKMTISYDGKTLDVDARPSDGIAVALRAKAPIYMAESVLERAAVREE